MNGPVFEVRKDGVFISSHVDYNVAFNRAAAIARGDKSATVKVIYTPTKTTKAIFRNGRTAF